MQHNTPSNRSTARLIALLLPLGLMACDADLDRDTSIRPLAGPTLDDEDRDDELETGGEEDPDDVPDGDEPGEPDDPQPDEPDEPQDPPPSDGGDEPPTGDDCDNSEDCGDDPPPTGTCEEQREQCLADGLSEESCQQAFDDCNGGPDDACIEEHQACLDLGLEGCNAILEQCQEDCELQRQDCLADGGTSEECHDVFIACDGGSTCEQDLFECINTLPAEVCFEIFGTCGGGGGGGY